MSSELQVLLIEDSPADAMLFQVSLDQAAVKARLSTVNDGLQGVDWLLRRPPYEHASTPQLIVMDINLPRLSGSDLIRQIRLIPEHKVTPLVVLSGGQDPRDVRSAYESGAMCLLRKPADLEEYLECVRTLMVLWTRFATLPPAEAE